LRPTPSSTTSASAWRSVPSPASASRSPTLIAVHCSSQLKFWEGLLRATGRQDLASHPDYDTRDKRIANYKALWAELGATFATRTRGDWAQRLEAEDVPYAPVLNVQEVIDDPQVQHLGTFYQVRHPSEGEVWGVYPPLRFDGERPSAMTAPPVLGEHTDEVLRELGFAAQEIAELRTRKVV
jgi:crotonobetainyl-CoA:carnitine CoA-transferase CaiB-like acyl-CoA transferase